MCKILLNIFKKLSFNKKEPEKVKKRSLTDYEFNEVRSEKLNKINKILDKISKHGMKSLSKEEIDFLNKYN